MNEEKETKREWLSSNFKALVELISIWLHIDEGWQKFCTWRARRIIARCDRRQHTLLGCIMKDGRPGKWCRICRYQTTISEVDFYKLFHKKFKQCVKRAVRKGKLPAATLASGRQVAG